MANGDVKLASQRGNMMLTTAIAVLAGSIITLTTAKNAINSANEATGTVVGNQLQVVVDGLNAYISSNSSALNAGSVAGVANAYAPTVDELKALGFIGSWIISAPTYGGSYINAVTKKDAACSINCSFYGTSRLQLPFVTTDKGGNVDIRLLQSAAIASKTSQIGYSLPGSSAQISGPGWVLTNPDSTSRSGILLATTNVVPKTGHDCPAYDVGKGIDCTSDTQFINLAGSNSTAIGIDAGAVNTSGTSNLFAGYKAGYSTTSGSWNTNLGALSGGGNQTGSYNVFIAGGSGKSTSNSVVIGAGAVANDVQDGLNNYTVIGSGAYARYRFSTVVGVNAKAYDGYTAIYGENAIANQGGDVSIGYNSYSFGGSWKTANAIGYYAKASGQDSLAVGGSSQATSSSIALGGQSKATGANSIAIGTGVNVTTANTVAIGNSSITQIGGQVAWSNLSDRRLKEDIRDSGRGLDFVKKLRPVDYTLISNNKAETGFIAQEVEEVDGAFPGVNKPANDADFYSLTYTDFIPALVKSIQELSDKVDGLDRHDCKASDLPLTIWLAIGGGLILFGWNVSLQRAVNKLKKAA